MKGMLDLHWWDLHWGCYFVALSRFTNKREFALRLTEGGEVLCKSHFITPWWDSPSPERWMQKSRRDTNYLSLE